MATSLFSPSYSNRIQRLVMEREEDEVPFLPPLENISNAHVRQPSLTVSSWKESLARGGDPRLAHLPFMGSSLPITLVLVSYILFVKVIGPRVMRNREPFELKRVLLVYNGLMILLSTSQFIRGGVYGWFPFMEKTYNYACQPVDYSYSREGMGMALTAYIYFLSKIVELLDTVFFILRKKDSHVTTLHVSHHALVAYLMYWGVKYFPGGHGSFQGFANSFVHMVMYTYYFLSAMGVRVWWKRYLTIIQMTQFVFILLHGIQILVRPECDYPKVIAYPYLAVVIYLLVMFVNFYRKAYNKARVERRKRRQEAIRAAELDSSNSTTEVTPQCHLLSIHDRIRATTSGQPTNIKEESNNTVLHRHLESVVQVRQRMKDQIKEEEKSDSKRVM